jgi:hypothetical protein
MNFWEFFKNIKKMMNNMTGTMSGTFSPLLENPRIVSP